MKAVSLWQPWATLWSSGDKRHETRHWPTRHRGWLLVHAAKKKVWRVDVASTIDDYFRARNPSAQGRGPQFEELPHGALLGAVFVIDCMATDELVKRLVARGSFEEACGDFSPGRFGWRAGQAKPFKTPIPYKGAQGIFEVPDELVADALREAGIGAK